MTSFIHSGEAKEAKENFIHSTAQQSVMRAIAAIELRASSFEIRFRVSGFGFGFRVLFCAWGFGFRVWDLADGEIQDEGDRRL
jgi:hypothetical protein